MFRFRNAALLGAVCIASYALAPMTPQDRDDRKEDGRRYHDKQRNDDHNWDRREDQAYRMWANGRHRSFVEFEKLKEGDRQSYWNWRHRHSDAFLKIEIH